MSTTILCICICAGFNDVKDTIVLMNFEQE
jgi:hypothetical protein